MMKERNGCYPLLPIFSVLIALTMVLTLLTPVMAQYPPGDDKGDPTNDEPYPKDPPVKKEDGPEIMVDRSDGRLHISTHLKKDGVADDLDFILKYKDKLEIYLELEHKEDRIETMMEAEYKFKCIIGLGDGFPSDGIDCDDHDRSIIKFKDMRFREVEYKEHEEGDVVHHKIDLLSKDESFGLFIEFDSQFEEADDGAMVPEPIDMKIKIKNFEYEEEDTRLAMVMAITSNVVFQVGQSDDDKPEIEETTGQVNEELGSAYLTFDQKANIDHAHEDEVDLKKKDIEGGTEIVLIYPKNYKVYHDIELGLLPQAIVLKGEMPLYGATVGAMAALFILTDPRVLARLKGK